MNGKLNFSMQPQRAHFHKESGIQDVCSFSFLEFEEGFLNHVIHMLFQDLGRFSVTFKMIRTW